MVFFLEKSVKSAKEIRRLGAFDVIRPRVHKAFQNQV